MKNKTLKNNRCELELIYPKGCGAHRFSIDDFGINGISKVVSFIAGGIKWITGMVIVDKKTKAKRMLEFRIVDNMIEFSCYSPHPVGGWYLPMASLWKAFVLKENTKKLIEYEEWKEIKSE